MVLYPNPAKEKVYLGNATIGTPFKILDNAGRNVKSGQINNILEEIDIEKLSPGIYYIDIKQGNFGNRRWKFVKE
jgi:hypothetical protein